MAINWVDRVATHPGRVQLTPVQGQTNIYDMERADEPTVAGTPLNAANLNAMQKNAGLDANMTVYVAVSGSNSTGNGSSTAPYQTITKALSVIPKQLNGYVATINVSAGTYNENVSVEKFSGGYVVISGTRDANVEINYLLVDHCVLSIENISVTVAKHYSNIGLYLLGGKLYIANNLTIATTGSQGIYMNRSSFLYVGGILTVNGASASPIAGIIVVQSSVLHATEIAGGNNVNVGITSGDGAQVSFRVNRMTPTIAYVTSNGGRIFSGSQTSIPNY